MVSNNNSKSTTSVTSSSSPNFFLFSRRPPTWAHFLLVPLACPPLTSSFLRQMTGHPSRVVNLSSFAHNFVSLRCCLRNRRHPSSRPFRIETDHFLSRYRSLSTPSPHSPSTLKPTSTAATVQSGCDTVSPNSRTSTLRKNSTSAFHPARSKPSHAILDSSSRTSTTRTRCLSL